MSPEDAILSKLEWAKESRSEIQSRDALGVALDQHGRLDLDQHGRLDLDYLRRWAIELGMSETLEAILEEADARA